MSGKFSAAAAKLIDAVNQAPAEPIPVRSLMPLQFKQYLDSYEEKIGFLRDLVRGLIDTDYFNSLIVMGPPGIGKTYNIDNILYDQSQDETNPIKYTMRAGKLTPLAFYQRLRDNADKNSISFFDDADSILTHETSLGLLKQASEHRKQRIITYESTKLDEAVTSCLFNGKIVIASNKDYARNEHFDAVTDRFHCYHMNISYAEKVAKIFEIVERSDEQHFKLALDVLDYLFSMQGKIDKDKLTLRMFDKLKHLAMMMPGRWKRFLEVSGTYFYEELDEK